MDEVLALFLSCKFHDAVFIDEPLVFPLVQEEMLERCLLQEEVAHWDKVRGGFALGPVITLLSSFISKKLQVWDSIL